MKKSLLFGFALSVGFAAVAQNHTNVVLGPMGNKVCKYRKDVINMDTPPPFSSLYTPAPTSTAKHTYTVQPTTYMPTTIGTTGYQLQTNRAGRNGLVFNSDGTVSTVWIFSTATSGWADRGSGYQYYNGSAWGSAPTVRVETVRTGWGEIAVTSSGAEVIINHTSAAGQVGERRPVKGTGNWTETMNPILSPSVNNLWPRLAAGGSTTLHAISITEPTANGGMVYQGLDGALCYAKSTDDGVTWSSWSTLTGIDSANGYSDFAGDEYAIDARGNVVAIVFGGFSQSQTLLKSTDAGVTWTKTVIRNFPIANYTNQITDTNNDNVPDTLTTSDGSMDVVIDNNNEVHVVYGRMRVIAVDTSGLGFFPVTSGVYYWNESMGAGNSMLIADVTDDDASGTFDLPTPQPSTDFPFGAYYCSMTSHPTIGVDGSNNIFVAYDAVIENTDEGSGHAYRNLMVLGSTNGGTSWTTPVRVKSDNFTEQVYPQMAPHFTGSCIPLEYMSDAAPGNGITLQGGGSTSPDLNNTTADIMYGCLNETDVLSTHDLVNNVFNVVDNYPNPTSDISNLSIVLNKESKVTIALYNAMGAKVDNVISKDFSAGSYTFSYDASHLASGVYYYTIDAGGFRVTKKMVKM